MYIHNYLAGGNTTMRSDPFRLQTQRTAVAVNPISSLVVNDRKIKSLMA